MAEIKLAEQKLVGTLGHWVLRTTNASAKRSAEQRCRTKIAEQKLQNKNWWGLLDIGCWGPQVQVQKGQQNKNVEQKIAEQKLVQTLRHWVLRIPSVSPNK